MQQRHEREALDMAGLLMQLAERLLNDEAVAGIPDIIGIRQAVVQAQTRINQAATGRETGPLWPGKERGPMNCQGGNGSGPTIREANDRVG